MHNLVPNPAPAAELPTHAYRTHTCGILRLENVGAQTRLSGWMHRIRDHGGLLFIDLRDHYGITQIVIDPDSSAFETAKQLYPETVIRIDGEVRKRDSQTINPKIPTGEVEVFCRSLKILNPAEELPLPVFGEPNYPEDLRLRYRYLDLRRPGAHQRIALRSRVVSAIRRRLEAAGFIEFQTPILTASSPEGARDYLVPSRMHPGKFYALPQAPQQYKQLVMIAGFDRYFQIAPCFRDEDARADRSPGEFYQIDIEMSFVEQEDIFTALEPILYNIFHEFGGGREIQTPFPRIAYRDAIETYGTDKPDLRNPIRLQTVSEHFRRSGFGIFADILERDPEAEVRALPAPGGGSRGFCDRMNRWAQEEGQPGLAHILFREENGQCIGAGPVARNLGTERTETLRAALQLKPGDSVFFSIGRPEETRPFLALARNRIAEKLGLVEENRFAFCWIVDFPLYEQDQDGQINFSHNPFSMPQGGLEALNTQHPLNVLGYQYDIVCNGIELSSGAIRNHRLDIMFQSFKIAGYSREDVLRSFPGMVNALRFGAPPHGGIAPGLDRIVMLLADTTNIREVIMFPMNQRAEELMLDAPSSITDSQLSELGLRRKPSA